MLRARIALLILSVGVLFGSFACDVPNPPALVVLGNVVPDDSCTVKVEGGGQQAFLFEGTLDVSLGATYQAHFMVENNFPQFESLTGFQPQNAQLDGSTVNLDKVIVTLRLPKTDTGQTILAANLATPGVVEQVGNPPGAGILANLGVTVAPDLETLEYVQPIQFTIAPTATGLAFAKLIDIPVGNLLRLLPELVPAADNSSSRLKLLADFTVSGVRMDGRRVNSAVFSYPITVCHNCLVSHIFPESTAVSPYSPPGDSEPLTDDEIMPDGRACTLGSDKPVTNAICGAIWPGPGPGDPNECARDRCLGKGSVATGADNLVCPSDTSLLVAEPAPAASGLPF